MTYYGYYIHKHNLYMVEKVLYNLNLFRRSTVLATISLVPLEVSDSD